MMSSLLSSDSPPCSTRGALLVRARAGRASCFWANGFSPRSRSPSERLGAPVVRAPAAP
ncbi:MAG: hypothetical protein U0703_02415 [Anaerolineae bacterium]